MCLKINGLDWMIRTSVTTVNSVNTGAKVNTGYMCPRERMHQEGVCVYILSLFLYQ
jgi:hypothetical protein